MRSLWMIFAVMLLLTGCFGNAARQGGAARHDFGAMTSEPLLSAVVAVEVGAPAWLADSAMQYRLSYAEPTRRFDYADSRWAAAPAELLGQVLERRLGGAGAARCRLHFELDELVQNFSAPQTSHVQLLGRATLFSGAEAVARRVFAFTRPAPSADAQGGVAATALVVRALSDELAAWLVQVDRCH